MKNRMHVGILTHYDVLNQGAQLQMYALYHEVKKMGHTVEIITYEKNFDFAKEEKLKNQVSVRSIPYYLSEYLIKKGVGLTLHNVLKFWKMKKFRKETFCFSDIDSTKYDCVLVGSDEVFSIPVGYNAAMFGEGVKTDILASYAPAYGQTDIARVEQYNCRDRMKKGLEEFDYLSARDVHTKNMIKEISGRDAQLVCDPVLLYDFDLSKFKKRPIKDKYMIVYSYDRFMNEQDEIKNIRLFGKKHNLKIVSVGTYHKWCDMNVVCDPLEWIKWFMHAEFIITDTFHGSILSIVCRKNFGVFIRSQINENKIGALLKDVGLEDRKLAQIDNKILERFYQRGTNYEVADKKILHLQEESRKYLNNILRNN